MYYSVPGISFLPRGDPARQRRVHQHLTARRGALWKKWLPVKFSFISLRHVFPASFVRSFHERCACSWLYGKEFTFHTSFNQNQRRRVAEKKTWMAEELLQKPWAFQDVSNGKRNDGAWNYMKYWLFRYIFDVRSTTQRNCIRASYSLYLNTNERW